MIGMKNICFFQSIFFLIPIQYITIENMPPSSINLGSHKITIRPWTFLCRPLYGRRFVVYHFTQTKISSKLFGLEYQNLKISYFIVYIPAIWSALYFIFSAFSTRSRFKFFEKFMIWVISFKWLFQE